MPIAMGVPITAAALFETTLVSIASSSMSDDSTTTGPESLVAKRNSRSGIRWRR